jgi:quercetin dioxygenase-like cupin family protein
MIANVSTGMVSGASNASQAPTGAVASLAGPQVWPGLNTQGVTHARLDFAIGGVIPLHTHPRAAETLLVLKGTIYTGFVSDDNVLYAATLQQGDVMLFPRAMLHFQLNVGKEPAITFNTLTSQNPGLLFTSNQVRIVLSSLSFPSVF